MRGGLVGEAGCHGGATGRQPPPSHNVNAGVACGGGAVFASRSDSGRRIAARRMSGRKGRVGGASPLRPLVASSPMVQRARGGPAAADGSLGTGPEPIHGNGRPSAGRSAAPPQPFQPSMMARGSPEGPGCIPGRLRHRWQPKRNPLTTQCLDAGSPRAAGRGVRRHRRPPPPHCRTAEPNGRPLDRGKCAPIFCVTPARLVR